jgi:hypothetical protein
MGGGGVGLQVSIATNTERCVNVQVSTGVKDPDVVRNQRSIFLFITCMAPELLSKYLKGVAYGFVQKCDFCKEQR